MPQDEGINLFLLQRKNSIHDTYFKDIRARGKRKRILLRLNPPALRD